MAGMAVGEQMREAWFWAGVYRDHATFILDRLAPDQEQQIRWARGFEQTFTALAGELEKLAQQAGIPGPAGSEAAAEGPAEAPLARFRGAELSQYERETQRLVRSLLESLGSLRNFKQQLLAQMLDCTVKLALPPTLIAHMIVEAEEGQRALSGVRESANLPPALEALHHHLVWLPDASGHAAALHGNLDGVEQQLLLTTAGFKQIFDGMHIKALELYSMLRVAPKMVGALQRLNRDAMAQIATFRAFLADLREHLEGCEVLGSLMPLLADHMLREELYYTEKIMQVGR